MAHEARHSSAAASVNSFFIGVVLSLVSLRCKVKKTLPNSATFGGKNAAAPRFLGKRRGGRGMLLPVARVAAPLFSFPGARPGGQPGRLCRGAFGPSCNCLCASGLQNGLFHPSKRPVLEPETARFAMQNGTCAKSAGASAAFGRNFVSLQAAGRWACVTYS